MDELFYRGEVAPASSVGWRTDRLSQAAPTRMPGDKGSERPSGEINAARLEGFHSTHELLRPREDRAFGAQTEGGVASHCIPSVCTSEAARKLLVLLSLRHLQSAHGGFEPKT